MKHTLIFFQLILFAITTSCSQEPQKVIAQTYPDGSIELEQYYLIKNQDSILVKEIGYYPQGQKRIEGPYVNKKREGHWIYWYENGNKWSEAEYVDDIRHGRSTVWYENGKKYYEGDYLKGERVGKWKFWDEEGNLLKEIDYNE